MICVYYQRTNHKCECGKPAKWKVYECNPCEYVCNITIERWLCPTCKKEKVI